LIKNIGKNNEMYCVIVCGFGVDSTTLENVSVAGQFEYCNEPWVP
jgi:hypothetical protein